MEQKEQVKARRESHWRYLAWIAIVMLLVIGFRIILTSVTDISSYFWLGILFIVLASFWYGYDKGHNVGLLRGYERGLAAQRKKQQ